MNRGIKFDHGRSAVVFEQRCDDLDPDAQGTESGEADEAGEDDFESNEIFHASSLQFPAQRCAFSPRTRPPAANPGNGPRKRPSRRSSGGDALKSVDDDSAEGDRSGTEGELNGEAAGLLDVLLHLDVL